MNAGQVRHRVEEDRRRPEDRWVGNAVASAIERRKLALVARDGAVVVGAPRRLSVWLGEVSHGHWRLAGGGTENPNRKRLGFSRVEARGVEPRSEIRSTTASTCVARRLGSAATGRRAAHCCTSLLGVSPGAKRRDAGLSRYCDTPGAASGGLHQEQRQQQLLRVTRRGPVQCWQLWFCRVFYQRSAAGHAATASPTPSNPGRPRGLR